MFDPVLLVHGWLGNAWVVMLWQPKTSFFAWYQGLFIAVALIATAIGSWVDMRIREVPDLVNYSLIAFGITARIILALWLQDISIITAGVAGFIIAFAIAMGMFYAGQWGGGDAKMIMGLGILLGLHPSWDDTFIAFLLNSIWVGAVYGLLWSLYLGARNWRRVSSRIFANIPKYSLYILVLLSCVVAVLSVLWLGAQSLLFVALFPVLGIALLLLMAYIRAVEKVCMIQTIPVEKLTPGDWILKDVRIKGKYIAGPKDLGIDPEQIALLKKLKKQNLVRTIAIKVGIPFVPSFLISLILTVFLGNVLTLLF